MTVPNWVSASGVLFSFLYIYFYLHDNVAAALVFFGLVYISDLLDGFLAKYLKQETVIGAVIDAVRDKIFFIAMVGNVIYLGITKAETVWLTVALFIEFLVWLNAAYQFFVNSILINVKWHHISRIRGIGYLLLLSLIIFEGYFDLGIDVELIFPMLIIIPSFSLIFYLRSLYKDLL